MIRRLSLITTVAGVLACNATPPPKPGDLRGMLYVDPLAKPEFELVSTAGDTFSFKEETEGFVTLLFFGYTSCPDICPIHMASIASVLRTLTPQVAHRVKVVMVTTDPERDTPERFRKWLDNFDRSFIGLTGSHEDVNAIQRQLLLPRAVTVGDGDDYTVGHSASVIAFTTDNRAHVSYGFGTRQADWAHDLPMLVNSSWESLEADR